MKVTNQPARKGKINLRFDCFSLSVAKTYLGRLMEKASKGEVVFITRGQHRFLLQEIPPIDPIPVRPAGYFASCYSKEEVQELNQLAKASLVRAPEDIE